MRLAAILMLVSLPAAAPADVPLDPLAPILRAVARTEGFYRAGTLPRRLHNPGALRVHPTLRYARFATDADGWLAMRAWFADHCGPLRQALTIYNHSRSYAEYVIRLGDLDPQMEVCP